MQLTSVQEIGKIFLDCFPQLQAEDGASNITSNINFEACAFADFKERNDLVDLASSNEQAFVSLSFNWNRCWDQEEFGNQMLFHPTNEMIAAVRPEAQEEYFIAEWESQQSYWYGYHLPANASIKEEREAFLRSLEKASGMEACSENTAGTAWFFFTIMTTIGYGNQAPVTNEGRLLVVTAGLLCVVLFASVLAMSGYILLAIMDDFFERFRVSTILAQPVIGACAWGCVWLLYAFVAANSVQGWWEKRLPEFGADVTRFDALWFSFISTSTIGLGDYFLQPQVIFASDSLKYSVLFTVGFVLLSTFFGKIALCICWILPKNQDSFHAKLKRTTLLGCVEKRLFELTMAATEETELDLQGKKEQERMQERITLLKSLLHPCDPDSPDDGQSEMKAVHDMRGSQQGDILQLLHEEEEEILHRLLDQAQKHPMVYASSSSTTESLEDASMSAESETASA